MSDRELIARTLESVASTGDARRIARELLALFGNYAGVVSASPHDLKRVYGLGDAEVSSIKLAQASVVRFMQSTVESKPVLHDSASLRDYLQARLAHETIERVHVLYLSSSHVLIADETHSVGTVDYVAVYPREIFKRALEFHATSLILVHNHVSGSCKPSPEDIEMTKAVQEVGKVLRIPLLDHIIVSGNAYHSFKNAGRL